MAMLRRYTEQALEAELSRCESKLRTSEPGYGGYEDEELQAALVERIQQIKALLGRP